MKIAGQLRKMTHEATSPIQYYLSLDRKEYPITPEVGKIVTLKFLGKITCVECGRTIRKTYNDGYCFPCARDLPENDICAVRPEKCRHEYGDEQAREFWRTHCNVDHFVYLAQTSGVKVGITRHFNVPARWIDQGAVQALIIARVPQRILSGKIEVALAKNMSDRTNWRKMIRGDIEEADLPAIREKALAWIPEDLRRYALPDEKVQAFTYPVQAVPEKISSHNLDREREFSERFLGIKGQYLIFQNRVINLRKFSGYHVEFSFEN